MRRYCFTCPDCKRVMRADKLRRHLRRLHRVEVSVREFRAWLRCAKRRARELKRPKPTDRWRFASGSMAVPVYALFKEYLRDAASL